MIKISKKMLFWLILINFLSTFTVNWYFFDKAYDNGYKEGLKVGWLRGYNQRHIDNLPSPGLEKKITRNPNLKLKG